MAQACPIPLAIRMLCMRAEVTRKTHTACVTVSALGAGRAQSGLACKDCGPDAIGAAVQAYAVEHGRL
ncbi:MAG: hypothetical protein O3C57_02550, partial [Verrucomicrobia bacterium]|nr:hypothetical protein [Verrucomicrobiota bacterium]